MDGVNRYNMYSSSSKLTSTTKHNTSIRRNASNNSHSISNVSNNSNNSHSTTRDITLLQCMRRIKHNHNNIRARLGKAGVERV